MSKFIMNVDFFNNTVAARTDKDMLCLNDMFFAGNKSRMDEGKAALQMNSFLNSKALSEYVAASAKEWGIDESEFIMRGGKGRNAKTWVHLSVAILAAEQLSPKFHAHIHRVFIEGHLLEHRRVGATEFRRLNGIIENKLIDTDDQDYAKRVYIGVAKKIRHCVLGEGATTKDWNNATVEQTQQRQSLESDLCKLLKLDMVESPKHLLQLIEKLTND